MARGDPQINLRLPGDLRAWLQDRAARNFRSLSGEMVALLSEKRNSENSDDAKLAQAG